MLKYGSFWNLYQKLKEGSGALVLTCCEVGFRTEKLFTRNCVVLQNLGGSAETLNEAEVSIAARRAQESSGELNVVVLTHDRCSFQKTERPFEHAIAALKKLSQHPSLAQASFHCCHLDDQGQLWAGDYARQEFVSPLSAALTGDAGTLQAGGQDSVSTGFAVKMSPESESEVAPA